MSSSESKSLLTPHNTIKRVTHIIPYASSWVKTLRWFFSSVISHIALILAVIPFQGAHKTPSGTPVSCTNRCVGTPHLSLSHCGVCLDGVKQWYYLRHNDITPMWRWVLDLFSHSHPFCHSPHTVIKGNLPAGRLVNWSICQKTKKRKRKSMRQNTSHGRGINFENNGISVAILKWQTEGEDILWQLLFIFTSNTPYFFLSSSLTTNIKFT